MSKSMKIYILNESKQSLGGGWSFIRNFKKGLQGREDVMLVSDWRDADIVFIPAATMTSRDTVSIVHGAGKKIVLRLDNIPRNSRNRGTGTSRLYDITQIADKVIYQSMWARDYLMPFLGKWGPVVYNGVDTEIFNKEGEWVNFGDYSQVVLYSRYNRDETKGWERAWYEYQLIHRQDPNTLLVLLGRFSEELVAYNFDFYNNETVKYLGVEESPEKIASIMRGCDILLAPYFNDCYSNTIQEAMACGLELRVDLSGGTSELLSNKVITLETMVTNYVKEFDVLLQSTT